MRLPAPPWIAAHRGALPRLENTLPALELAVAEGADLVEIDVQATADGTLVVFHDQDLGRLGGRPDLVVERARSEDLRGLVLRHPQDPHESAPLPTLDEALARLPAGCPVNIELKRRLADPQRLAETALAATAGRPNVLFSSFDHALLVELRRSAPEVALAPLAPRWSAELETFARELGAFSLHVAGGVRAAQAARAAVSGAARAAVSGAARAAVSDTARAAVGVTARAAGPHILVYTVNVARRAQRLCELGAAGVFTDRPGGLRRELGVVGATGV